MVRVRGAVPVGSEMGTTMTMWRGGERGGEKRRDEERRVAQ